MTTQYIVESCTLHGATKQRRWHRVHTGPNKADCQAYLDSTISSLYAHWAPERAAGLFRIRGVSAAA